MKRYLVLILLGLTIWSFGFCQNRLKDSLSISSKGIFLTDYTILWEFDKSEIMNAKLLRLESGIKGGWEHIKFDSITFLNDILLKKVVLKCGRQKKRNKLKVIEFIGEFDLANFEQLSNFLSCKDNKWKHLGGLKPFCRFRLVNDKKSGHIVIQKM